jgi:glycosyltransferase involved in cell wall biosynthesis
MRILMVADSLDMGGAERHVVGLVQALRRRSHDVALAVSAAGPLLDLAEQMATDVWVVGDERVKRRVSPSFAQGLRTVIGRHRPEVVHAHMFASAAAATLAIADAGSRLVITEHSEGAWRGEDDVRIAAACYSAADYVIAVSDALCRRLRREGVPPWRIVTVPNALLPLAPESQPAPPLPARPRSRTTIGVVARLRPEKGLAVFLRASAEVAGLRPDVSFVIAGEGPEGPLLRALAHDLGLAERVAFLGVCPDGASLLADVDIAVLPSVANEGTPLVVLEAMRAGTPLVATRVGGIPEQVRHLREALLVAPGDAPALAKAMLSLLDDRGLAQRLGAARGRYERRCSPEAMVRETEAVYARAVAEAGERSSAVPLGGVVAAD